MPDYSRITVFILTPLIFRYHLPLTAKVCEFLTVRSSDIVTDRHMVSADFLTNLRATQSLDRFKIADFEAIPSLHRSKYDYTLVR
jgi:hypothetical protein